MHIALLVTILLFWSGRKAAAVCTKHINVVHFYNHEEHNELAELVFNSPQATNELNDPNMCFDIMSERTPLYDVSDVGLVLFNYFQHLNESKTIHLILGPLFSSEAEPVSEISNFYHLNQIGYSWTSPAFSNAKFQYTTRTAPSLSITNPAVSVFLDHFKWKRIGLVSSDISFLSPAYDDFRNLLTQKDIKLPFFSLMKSNGEAELDSLKKLDVRINVAFIAIPRADRLECWIYNKKMYGPKYQWIFSGLPLLTNYQPNVASCTKEQFFEASENIIFFESSAFIRNYQANFATSYTSQLLSSINQTMFNIGPSINTTLFTALSIDSYWTSVLGLTRTIKSLGITDPSNLGPYMLDKYKTFANTLRQNIRNTTFKGISGDVSFFADSGDRSSSTIIYQVQKSKLVEIARYDRVTKLIKFLSQPIFPGGKSPRDEIDRVKEIVRHEMLVSILFISLATLGTLACVMAITFNQWFSYLRFIKMSSHRLNNLLLLGCIFCYAYVAISGIEPNQSFENRSLDFNKWDLVCKFSLICVLLGFDCTFGALFVKTWRVHMIFSNRKLRKKIVKDWQLFGIIAILVLVDLIIVTVMEIISPNMWITKNLGEHETSQHIIVTYVNLCKAKYDTYFFGALMGLKAIMIIFGIFFAFETRKVYLAVLNDSRLIGLCIYNVMILSGISVALSYVLTDAQNVTKTIVVSLCIWICATSTALIIFLPKVIGIVKNWNSVDTIAAERTQSEGVTKLEHSSSTA